MWFNVKRVSWLGVLCLVVGWSNAKAAELVVVDAGESRAPIVVFAEAPPMTRQAADALADYIEKISGARPPVHAGLPDPLPESAIWVGHQPVLDALFPELDFDFQHPEEILIAANDRHLVIAGRDRWDPQHLRVEFRFRTVDGVQQEYGTANAVYTFIQDFLAVRWLWPGEWGEEVPTRERLAFAPFTHRHHPQIRGRGGILNYSQLGRGGYGRSEEWARLQRLQLSSMAVEGGHAFSDWWVRFHESHPEYFALQPDGTRGGGDEPYPGASTVKMCKSNPAVWQQWLADVEAQIAQHPTRRVFNAAANDGWSSGYCVCENCTAWDHPEGELRRYVWVGASQNYVAMSDRQVTFANRLGRLLKERYPDRDYFVQIHAYGPSRPAPVEAVPDANVLVTSVANFLTTPDKVDRGSLQGSLHRDQFAGWGEVTRNLFWRPNKARRMCSKPLLPLTRTIEDIRFLAEHNCVGIHIDMVWEHWATRGPLYYVMAQMAWDPMRDGPAMLADYYERGFGLAAGSIRAYWELMESKWAESRRADPGARYGMETAELFDDALFAQADALLDRAAEAVADAPERFGRRIDFVRMGLDYTRMLTEARRLMLRFEASGGTDQDAADRARAIWVDGIMPLATSEIHPHAINWGPARPGHGHRSAGRYPADLHQKW